MMSYLCCVASHAEDGLTTAVLGEVLDHMEDGGFWRDAYSILPIGALLVDDEYEGRPNSLQFTENFFWPGLFEHNRSTGRLRCTCLAMYIRAVPWDDRTYAPFRGSTLRRRLHNAP